MKRAGFKPNVKTNIIIAIPVVATAAPNMPSNKMKGYAMTVPIVPPPMLVVPSS